MKTEKEIKERLRIHREKKASGFYIRNSRGIRNLNEKIRELEWVVED